MVSKLVYTGLAMFVLLAVPAPVQQEAAGTRVIVQNPRAVHKPGRWHARRTQ